MNAMLPALSMCAGPVCVARRRRSGYLLKAGKRTAVVALPASGFWAFTVWVLLWLAVLLALVERNTAFLPMQQTLLRGSGPQRE